MDKRSIDKPEDVKEALKPLKEDKVKVVPVAVGPDADKDQLKNITSAEGYLVKAEKTTTPEKLAKDIMDKVTSGMNSIEHDVCKCVLIWVMRIKLFWKVIGYTVPLYMVDMCL